MAWKTEVVLMEKLAHDILPTTERMASWFGNHVVRCSLCDMEGADSFAHLYLRCGVTRAIWFSCKWGTNTKDGTKH
ncbi:hypothetical protein F8388_027214 [Cannabis sativa]|uniref:Reverse transcriptase zinc-binding domain-containing protein n=1 Tax=Cannabis sativa TaxID=3483 RepID=A0A7J6HXZ7_CANSA|nr:hypothetical protein F8388_027214 [Cannabis sativa]KAF4399608.1 hypothetical protein G4B88_022691 [Cannabis sativa]